MGLNIRKKFYRVTDRLRPSAAGCGGIIAQEKEPFRFCSQPVQQAAVIALADGFK
jgi:hypothetical protein